MRDRIKEGAISAVAALVNRAMMAGMAAAFRHWNMIPLFINPMPAMKMTIDAPKNQTHEIVPAFCGGVGV